MAQSQGSFDLDVRHAARSATGDPLVRFSLVVDFEMHRPSIANIVGNMRHLLFWETRAAALQERGRRMSETVGRQRAKIGAILTSAVAASGR